ncbi:tRNA (guanine-N(7)-)-methyltransferase [Hamiltosporidium tvaerminnensis]|uniref:tRNA (guanine-N(7)-)-methyltransferase n=1 Tax=Hamiltosporidium tvaerminnensis TaxID=1176355 RepID=A0A4Q9KX65_9MICR|nr:tRNA (guanine-N(7)-)-methyltransferase [Hamiltosporidium tvaerminnensis]
MANLPRKKDFRQRAHANPFSDKHFDYLKSPCEMNWSEFYIDGIAPKIVDIGCGYGNFLILLSKIFPTENVVGLEIRKKVVDYIKNKVSVMIERKELKRNLHAIYTNAMLFLPNYFGKEQVSKIFILFPDPHFKKKKRKARIICTQMLDQYAYILENKGRLYLSTDVSELFESMVQCVQNHTLFRRLENEEFENDNLRTLIIKETDESKRAAVKTGKAFAAIFEKK